MIRTLARGAGQLLITLGVIVLLFAAYELYGTGLATAHAQHQLSTQLNRQWAAGAHQPVRTPAGAGHQHPGTPVTADGQRLDGVAKLYIPAFGPGWAPRVIVEGVALSDLAIGPGHYPGTALPGQVGNFAVAGHRATHGNGFMALNTLVPGDALVVETRARWYTYTVTGSERVLPTETDVIDPVPHHPGATPTKRLITLTTCDPWYSATHRLIVHGVLTSTQPRGHGRPAALRS
jgi:sortase A